MAAVGEIDPVTAAIHGDTGWERAATYAFAETWTPWLEERGVKVVTTHHSAKSVIETNGTSVLIPAFTETPGSAKGGQIRRQCTNRWKIQPVRRAIRKLFPGYLGPGDVSLLMGISMDEWSRARESDVKYIKNTYPLLDRKMSRQDCMIFLKKVGVPSPVKSACVFCPYQNKRRWGELKAAGGADWEMAIGVDERIRDIRPPHQLFVHPSRVPLRTLVTTMDGQSNMFDEDEGCATGFCFV
jgi:hypothetical protein